MSKRVITGVVISAFYVPRRTTMRSFLSKNFKVISGLRNTDLMTFPFSSKNRKRRVPEKISCKFFGMFHKTLTFFGGWATFLTDVVRVSFQSTKKTCETVFLEQFPKIATYLGHIEQKKFDVFLTNFSTIKKNSLSNLFWKTPRIFDFFSLWARKICIVISSLRFTCLEKKLLDDNINFPKNFVFSYFCFLFEQILVVLGCSICILRLQETNFSGRVF